MTGFDIFPSLNSYLITVQFVSVFAFVQKEEVRLALLSRLWIFVVLNQTLSSFFFVFFPSGLHQFKKLGFLRKDTCFWDACLKCCIFKSHPLCQTFCKQRWLFWNIWYFLKGNCYYSGKCILSDFVVLIIQALYDKPKKKILSVFISLVATLIWEFLCINMVFPSSPF